MPRPLIVVAVRQEAAHLTGADVLLTGIGKVAAAAAVARALAERRPSRVVNIGTAGALRDGLEGIHRIGRVLEHDVDHAALAALIGEPVVGEVELDPSLPTVLATGDAFISSAADRARLAERAHLVDMEGYAVARACADAGVPCALVKVVSDAADETAGHTWVEQADALARVIAEVVAAELRTRLGRAGHRSPEGNSQEIHKVVVDDARARAAAACPPRRCGPSPTAGAPEPAGAPRPGGRT